jgi:hypothetical protein
MLKPYLLVFNDTVTKRQQVLDYLDTCHEVKNWYAFLSNGIFIISKLNASALSALIRNKFPDLWFIITEIPSGANDGWQTEVVWNFINNPKSSGRWPE